MERSKEIMNLRNLVDQYSQDWEKEGEEPEKQRLFMDEEEYENEGRNLLYNVRSKEMCKQRLNALANSIKNIEPKEVSTVMRNHLQQIALKVNELAENILTILEIESENFDDIFTKSEKFELSQMEIKRTMGALEKLIRDFYRDDNFPNAKEAQLSFSVILAAAKFVNEFSGETCDFLEMLVPLLTKFLGFMSLRFPEAMKAAIDDILETEHSAASDMEKKMEKSIQEQKSIA
jgi:hypothetical protein